MAKYLDEEGLSYVYEKLRYKLIPANSGSHNSIYRGNDITELYYDGTLSTEIANGTFDDIFIGDYIVGQSTGNVYLVAHLDYFLNMGYDVCEAHHVTLIPEAILTTAQMYTSNTTKSYVESTMYTSTLPSLLTTIEEDFETILPVSLYLLDSVSGNYENDGDWYTRSIDLMNEKMVFGSDIYHDKRAGTSRATNYTINSSQLALFNLNRSKITGYYDNERTAYWLKDFESSAVFCRINIHGSPSYAAINTELGVRPYFSIT